LAGWGFWPVARGNAGVGSKNTNQTTETSDSNPAISRVSRAGQTDNQQTDKPATTTKNPKPSNQKYRPHQIIQARHCSCLIRCLQQANTNDNKGASKADPPKLLPKLAGKRSVRTLSLQVRGVAHTFRPQPVQDYGQVRTELRKHPQHVRGSGNRHSTVTARNNARGAVQTPGNGP